MKNKKYFLPSVIFGTAVLLQLAGLVFLAQAYDWNWWVLMSFGPQYPMTYWVCQGLTILLLIPEFMWLWQKFSSPMKRIMKKG